jgi:hypothetical protein
MTIRLRLSDDGSTREGSSDPTSKRDPSSEPTEAEIFAHSKQPLTVAEYGSAILSERAKQDPTYRRELDARLAAGHYWGRMGEALTAPQDTAGYIVQADPSVNPAIAQRGVDAGPFVSREERASAYADARYATSQDFRDLVISRDALTSF